MDKNNIKDLGKKLIKNFSITVRKGDEIIADQVYDQKSDTMVDRMVGAVDEEYLNFWKSFTQQPQTVSTSTIIGSHVSFKTSLTKTAQDTLKVSPDCNGLQFFLGSNLSIKRSTLTASDVESFNTWNKTLKRPLPIFSHMPYCHNLAGSIKHKSLASNLDMTPTISSLQHELNEISKLVSSPIKGCVLHIGATPKTRSEGLNEVAKTINQVNIPSDTYLCLETMVQRGNVLGTSFDELNSVLKMCSQPERIKICIDTCHIHANGNYNLSQKDQVQQMFSDFYSTFPTDKLALFHLNDSKVEFNAKQDKHEFIGKGKIWSLPESHEAYKYLIERCQQIGCPAILETDFTDHSNAVQLSLR